MRKRLKGLQHSPPAGLLIHYRVAVLVGLTACARLAYGPGSATDYSVFQRAGHALVTGDWHAVCASSIDWWEAQLPTLIGVGLLARVCLRTGPALGILCWIQFVGPLAWSASIGLGYLRLACLASSLALAGYLIYDAQLGSPGEFPARRSTVWRGLQPAPSDLLPRRLKTRRLGLKSRSAAADQGMS